MFPDTFSDTDKAENMMDEHEGQSRSVAAMGERVARVETKIENVEKNTDVIRATMHGFAGNMQKFVIQEADCVASLKLIAEQTKHLPDIVATVQSIDEMKPRLQTLMDEEQRRKGGWRVAMLIGTAIASTITALAAISGGIIWALGKVMVNHP